MFVLAAVLAWPGMARAETVVSLYPVQGTADAGIRADAEALIASGVRASNRRWGAFLLRGPVPLKAACAPKATTECLAKQGRGGAVIYAEATTADGVVSVSMSLITTQGQRTKPSSFRFIPGLVDLRPVHYAVEQLEKAHAELNAPASADIASPTSPPVDAPAVATSADPAPGALVEADPPREEYPALTESPDEQPAPASSKWMRKTGISAAIGGAVMMGVGGFFGLRARSMSNDLSSRYTEGRLVAADRSKYDQVKTSNALATGLLIGGGVVAATGLTFWGVSSVSFDSDGRGGGNFYLGGRW